MLHTLPFWISLVGIMPYLLTPFSHKIRVANLFIEKMDAVKQVNFTWMMSHKVNLQLRNLLQIGYAIACLWMIAKFQRRRKQNTIGSTLHGKLIEKWLVAVSVFVLLTGLCYFVGAFLYFRYHSLARNITARYY